MNELLNIIPRFNGRRILVVGDLCLDEYILGKPQRLSREAPVPVLEFQGRFTLPGAAANPALNIQALGGHAIMVGVVGEDRAGEVLRHQLEEKGISCRGVIAGCHRLTTVKTRVVAEASLMFPQQVVRVDRQDLSVMDEGLKGQLTSFIRSAGAEADAILLSDYKGGVVCEEVIAVSAELAQGKIITVDSQGNLFNFKGFTLVKSNQQEAEAVLGRQMGDEASLVRGGNRLLKRLSAGAVLITRGGEGMSLFERGRPSLHIPAVNRSEVFDVTGAGDTVIAVATLALSAGASISHATTLANYAAGLVVRKLGNATTSQEELGRAILRKNWEALET
ncbi:MAG: PfkB family carbohydrate kinase [Dehalococcoidia bacterium]|nr:PfkB family carbohydrate kinase [Dehalococcoidia bacterium]